MSKLLAVPLALILLLATALTVSAGRPVPQCSVALGPGTDLTLSATGLHRNTEYSMWWAISAVDDGPAFYLASTSAHPSDKHGDWSGEAFTGTRSGWWYFHVSIPGTEFRDSVVTCEYQG